MLEEALGEASTATLSIPGASFFKFFTPTPTSIVICPDNDSLSLVVKGVRASVGYIATDLKRNQGKPVVPRDGKVGRST